MLATDWFPLLVRAVATASLVLSAAMAAERLGPVWGAIIASLPVSTGPAYVFLALQHDAGFIAASALNSAVANGATGLFLITYAASIGRWPHWRRLGMAVAVWSIAVVSFQQVAWSVAGAVASNCSIYGVGMVVTRTRAGRLGGAGRVVAPGRRWFELPVRAGLVAAFVSALIAASRVLGPVATGMAAVFPVSLISLIVILQRRVGERDAAGVAARALAPMLGFGAMLLVLHGCTRAIGVGPALAVALATSVLWSLALIAMQTVPRPLSLVARWAAWQHAGMGDIINLRRVKRARAKAVSAQEAAANRVLHGQTKAERAAVAKERALAERMLEGRRLSSGDAEGQDGTG